MAAGSPFHAPANRRTSQQVPVISKARRIRSSSVAGHCLALFLALASGPAGAQVVPSDARSGPDPELRAILQAAIRDASSFSDRFEAEVWLTDMSRRLQRQVPDHDERIKILKTVHQHATSVQLEPELVLAVIDVESNFDRFAISSASALGLMQVMPFWVKELGYEDKNILFDIHFNVLLGCRILKYYLDMENGDLIKGLARYNGSVGQRWYGDRVIERLRKKWFRG
jgi:soluble lytic murein transglycosylase-like protein